MAFEGSWTWRHFRNSNPKHPEDEEPICSASAHSEVTWARRRVQTPSSALEASRGSLGRTCRSIKKSHRDCATGTVHLLCHPSIFFFQGYFDLIEAILSDPSRHFQALRDGTPRTATRRTTVEDHSVDSAGPGRNDGGRTCFDLLRAETCWPDLPVTHFESNLSTPGHLNSSTRLEEQCPGRAWYTEQLLDQTSRCKH